MANQPVKDFFTAPMLTEAIETAKITRGIRLHGLPDSLLTVSPVKPVGTMFKFKRYNGERRAARQVNYGSPGAAIETPGSEWQTATVASAREEFVIDAEMQAALHSDLPYLRANAQREFMKRMEDYRTRFASWRVNQAASAILTGKIYTSPHPTGQGRIVTYASGTSARLDYDFGAVSLSQGANTITAADSTTQSLFINSWATSTVDIPGDIRNIKNAYLAATGEEPAFIAYGASVPGYMGSTNTAMQAYWSRNQSYNGKYNDTGEVPTGALGLDWYPAHQQYFLDESTSTPTVQRWLAASTIVVGPAIDSSWYELVEGSQAVPDGQWIGENVVQMVANTPYKSGLYSYALRDPHSMQLTQVTGDNATPFVKAGGKLWIIAVA